MLSTKILGITGAFTKNKSIKIIILLIEIAIILYAIAQSEEEENNTIELEEHN